MSPAASDTPHQRLDVWLCYARIAKTRSLGQALVQRGKVRVNRLRCDKPGYALKPGDVLTISLGPKVRVVEVAGFGKRRGPASEAAVLFKELTAALDQTTSSAPVSGGGAARKANAALAATAAANGLRAPGAGRPTKRERRSTEGLKGRDWDG